MNRDPGASRASAKLQITAAAVNSEAVQGAWWSPVIDTTMVHGAATAPSPRLPGSLPACKASRIPSWPRAGRHPHPAAARRLTSPRPGSRA
jgi:hypothetical protein